MKIDGLSDVQSQQLHWTELLKDPQFSQHLSVFEPAAWWTFLSPGPKHELV